MVALFPEELVPAVQQAVA
ncbi:hypothetical protein, partial [Escherichia coli]